MKYQKMIFVGIVLLNCLFCSSPKADLILKNGQVYTLERDQPWAWAVVIKGNRIMDLLNRGQAVDKYVGAHTRVVDLQGQMVVPGFIDAHVHFADFAAQQHDIQLLDVNDDQGLRSELKRVVANIGDNEWIVGGQWGGSQLWQAGKGEIPKASTSDRWQPDRWAIDDLSPKNPCFINSYDGELYLANTAALQAAGLETSDFEGMKLNQTGKPTGLIYKGSPAIAKIKRVIKPKSEKRILKEYRTALRLFAEMGIVEVHDMIRSLKEVDRYLKLQDQGELTCRIWMRPWLDLSDQVFKKGYKMGMHPQGGQRDYYLRFGGFKSANDGYLGSRGALLFEPYHDRPDYKGHYQEYNSDDDKPGSLVGNPEVFYNYCKRAVEKGFCVNSHAIGDRGVSEVIDVLERIHQDFNLDLSMFRIIHAEIVQPREFERIKKLNLIVETNPSQIADDMRWIKYRLGLEREKLAFPFRTFIDKGIIMNFGSDVPGNAGAIFYCHPKYVLNAAVNRTNNEGKPSGGWLPSQKITVDEALRCFTVNGAYACMREDKIRGTLKVGKLADLAVLDRNIIENDPADLLNMDIVMTVVDGKIVYKKN